MWFIDPYRLDTMQVYLPESSGTRSCSFRYQREELTYRSKRRFFMIFPSFNHLYLRNQSEVLTVAPIIYFRYQRDISTLSRFFNKSFPSFNHLYLSGGAPNAWHFSRMECDTGHALNDLFSKFGSVNIGAPAKVQKQKQKQNNKARTYRWTEWMND